MLGSNRPFCTNGFYLSKNEKDPLVEPTMNVGMLLKTPFAICEWVVKETISKMPICNKKSQLFQWLELFNGFGILFITYRCSVQPDDQSGY